MKYAKTISEFLENCGEWLPAIEALQEIILQYEFEETLKWGIPVYTIEKKNVVGVAAFKSFVTLWFYQGVFLKDNEKKLINAQEGVTKALRQWRFSSLEEIREDSGIISVYLAEAIENQKAGLEVKPAKKKALVVPSILQEAFDADSKLSEAFEKFSTSKKREFTDYIESAKREATKLNRLEKIKPMILGGIGLNDKYR